MGPTREVLIDADDSSLLEALDALLATASNYIKRTRKGRVWDVWVRNRPIHVQVGGNPAVVTLSAGCNASEDAAILREVADKIVEVIGGLASEPEK